MLGLITNLTKAAFVKVITDGAWSLMVSENWEDVGDTNWEDWISAANS